MTKEAKKETHLLTTKIVDLLVDENVQLKQARKILGPDASEAKVKAEAERRLENARKISASLEKPLGTSDRPFPMWGTQRIDHEDGQSSLQQILSVIADDTHPMKVYSERSYKEVIALAYCDMPVPSMLPLFFDGLERRKPESTNRTQMMIGDPGAGKSFLGGLQGRLRSKQSIEVFDCGGKNMNELLFEMVLDFGKGDGLATAIDKKLQAGTLHTLSMGLIEQLNTLETMPEEIAADPEQAKEWTEQHTAVTVDGNGRMSVDWEIVKTGSVEKITKAHDLLTRISHLEQLEGGGNALGMNSQYGPLIRWFIEGREGVLDEYNKSKEGSDNALQTVWQFLNGEIQTCTVENPLKNKDLSAGPSSFTFRREDMQAGFFVTLTGNKTEDGLTTRSLNKSVYSRLSPQTLPEPEIGDWQHRICQMMVGMPVSTLYQAFEDQADANPKEFGEWLMNLRKAKAEIEGVPVPELQETLLQNWQNVVNASQKLAQFYNAWANMTDAENLMANDNSDLVEEVDEEYSKKEGIDFRKIKQHLEEAIPIRPRMLPPGSTALANFKDFDKPPVLVEKEAESASVAFGTRLVEFLERMVFEKSEAVKKPELYKKLQTEMEAAHLRDVHLVEAARNGQRSVEQDLNVTVYDSSDLGKQALTARKVFCDFLREFDKDITEDDEQIITVDRLKKTLASLNDEDTAETKDIFVVNRDPETLGVFPLVGAKIKDSTTYPEDQKHADFNLGDMINHDDLMASLALPTVSAKNMAAIWDTHLSEMAAENALVEGGDTPEQAGMPDEALDIAENRSEQTPLATTTLSVLFEDASGKAKTVSVHVVTNTASGKSLVVGEKVPSKLQNAFAEAGIIHVDRHETGAKGKVDRALNTLTRGMKDEVKTFLVDAFKYRNGVDDEDTRSLAALMVDDKVDMTFYKWVLKSDKKLAM